MAKRNNQANAPEAKPEIKPEVKPKLTEAEEAKLAEPEAKPEVAQVSSKPKFRNNGPDVKIRLGSRNETKWITVKHAEVVEIPRKFAIANKFQEVK